MGRKINSISYNAGQYLNDIDTLILVCEKLVQRKIDDNPKSGIILNKGKSTERRIRYIEVYDLLVSLSDYFGIKGAFSIGICQDCKYFQCSPANPVIGRCSLKGDRDPVHQWDSCIQFSRRDDL